MRITTNRCRRKLSINQQTWRTEMPKRNRRRYNKSKMLVEKVKTSTVTISINKMKKKKTRRNSERFLMRSTPVAFLTNHLLYLYEKYEEANNERFFCFICTIS